MEISYIELAAEISGYDVNDLLGAKEHELFVAILLPNGQKHVYAKSVLESYAAEIVSQGKNTLLTAKRVSQGKNTLLTATRSRAPKSKKT